VVQDLLHCHVVDGCNLEVRLIGIRLAQRSYTVDQIAYEAQEPENAGYPPEAVLPEPFRLSLCHLDKNVEVIEEPVEQVEGSGKDVGGQRKAILHTRFYDLHSFYLKHALKEPEQRAGVPYFL